MRMGKPRGICNVFVSSVPSTLWWLHTFISHELGLCCWRMRCRIPSRGLPRLFMSVGVFVFTRMLESSSDRRSTVRIHRFQTTMRRSCRQGKNSVHRNFFFMNKKKKKNDEKKKKTKKKIVYLKKRKRKYRGEKI
eukprot:PhF_6_TR40710/c0_g1_i1/m.61214